MTQLRITTTFVTIGVSIGAGLQDGIPVITAPSGNTDPYIHSINGVAYSTRASDGATLTVAMIEAAPTCIKLPTVTGTAAPGNALTIEPGIWLYAGEYSGDPVFRQTLDGVNIKGGTGLTYTIGAADGQRIFAIKETFGGVTVQSVPVLLDFANTRIADPNDLGAKLLHWFDFSDVSNIYTTGARTANVASTGDTVGSVADKKTGSSVNVYLNGTSAVWDAERAQTEIDLADTAGFDTDAIVSELPASGEVHIAMRSDGAYFMAMSRKFSGGPVTMVANPAGTSAIDGGTHLANGAPLPGKLRDTGFEYWLTGEPVVASSYGLDMTGFNGQHMRLLNYGARYPFKGALTHIVITSALNSDERAALIDWLGERSPA